MRVKIQNFALAVVALAAPLACLAQPLPPTATRNCAQALANRLHVRLAGVNLQPNLSTPLSTTGRVGDQMILNARAPNGVQTGPMVCTFDRQGDVISLSRPAPVDDMPLVNAASQS